MKNHISEGKTLTITAGATIASGDLVLAGVQPGIAVNNAASGDPLVLHTEGVFTLAKASGAINPGAKVYWVAADKNVTTTASGNTLIGLCWASAAVASDATTVPVKLIPNV